MHLTPVILHTKKLKLLHHIHTNLGRLDGVWNSLLFCLLELLPFTAVSSLLTCTVAMFSLDIQNASRGGFASGVLPDCRKSFYNMKMYPSLIVKNRVLWKVMVEALCLTKDTEDQVKQRLMLSTVK